jgi:hypothetical protein
MIHLRIVAPEEPAYRALELLGDVILCDIAARTPA